LKIIILILAISVSHQAFAQQINTQGINPDKPVTVIYSDSGKNAKLAAYFINGRLSSQISTLTPNNIEKITVIKKGLDTFGVKYFGRVYITTKASYNLKLLSLNKLKAKYTNTKIGSSIFFIDNELVKNDYDNSFVDENNILEIKVEKLKSQKECLNLNVIKILTRSEENIEKSKRIYIKGLAWN